VPKNAALDQSANVRCTIAKGHFCYRSLPKRCSSAP
jgi:hypothetical protein